MWILLVFLLNFKQIQTFSVNPQYLVESGIDELENDLEVYWPYRKKLIIDADISILLNCTINIDESLEQKYTVYWRKNGKLMRRVTLKDPSYFIYRADERDQGCYEFEIQHYRIRTVFKKRLCLFVKKIIVQLKEKFYLPYSDGPVTLNCSHSGIEPYKNFKWTKSDNDFITEEELVIDKSEVSLIGPSLFCIFEDYKHQFIKTYDFDNDFALNYYIRSLTYRVDGAIVIEWFVPPKTMLQERNYNEGEIIVIVSKEETTLCMMPISKLCHTFYLPTSLDTTLNVSFYSPSFQLLASFKYPVEIGSTSSDLNGMRFFNITSTSFVATLKIPKPASFHRRIVLQYVAVYPFSEFEESFQRNSLEMVDNDGISFVEVKNLTSNSEYKVRVTIINNSSGPTNRLIHSKFYYIRTLPEMYQTPLDVRATRYQNVAYTIRWVSSIRKISGYNHVNIFLCKLQANSSNWNHSKSCFNFSSEVWVNEYSPNRELRLNYLDDGIIYSISLSEWDRMTTRPSEFSSEVLFETPRTTEILSENINHMIHFTGSSCSVNVSWVKFLEYCQDQITQAVNPKEMGFLLEGQSENIQHFKAYYHVTETTGIMEILPYICQVSTFQVRLSLVDSNGPITSVTRYYSRTTALFSFSLFPIFIISMCLYVCYYIKPRLSDGKLDSLYNVEGLYPEAKLTEINATYKIQPKKPTTPNEFLERFGHDVVCDENRKKIIKDMFAEANYCDLPSQDSVPMKDELDTKCIYPTPGECVVNGNIYVAEAPKTPNEVDIWKLVIATKSSNLVILCGKNPIEMEKSHVDEDRDVFPVTYPIHDMKDGLEFDGRIVRKLEFIKENVGCVTMEYSIGYKDVSIQKSHRVVVHLIKSARWFQDISPLIFAQFMVNYYVCYREYWTSNVVAICDRKHRKSQIFAGLNHLIKNMRQMDWSFNVQESVMYTKQSLPDAINTKDDYVYFCQIVAELCLYYVAPQRTFECFYSMPYYEEFNYLRLISHHFNPAKFLAEKEYHKYVFDPHYVPAVTSMAVLLDPVPFGFYNASLLNTPLHEERFIMAQIPHNKKTTDTFWHLVFQKKVRDIFVFSDTFDPEARKQIFQVFGALQRDRKSSSESKRCDGYYTLVESKENEVTKAMEEFMFERREFTMSCSKGFNIFNLMLHTPKTSDDYKSGFAYTMNYVFEMMRHSISLHSPIIFASRTGAGSAAVAAAVSLIPWWYEMEKNLSLTSIARTVQLARPGSFDSLKDYRTFCEIAESYVMQYTPPEDVIDA